MNTRLTTTVVVATLNSALFIEGALISLARQSRLPNEVIVVDGGSTDSTLAIVTQFPFVSVMNQQSRGYHRAWNEAIKLSRGNVLCFLDSDDAMMPSAIEKALVVLEQDALTDVVFGKVEFFTDSGDFPSGFRNHLTSGAHYAEIPGSMFVRREVFDRLGVFPDDWEILSDLVWFADLAKSDRKIVRINDVSLRKCVRKDSLSLVAAHQTIYKEEMMRLIRRQLLASSK